MEDTIKNILQLVEENKSDSQLYYTIFKVLTENGKHKNFSSNKNGVFFNMNAFDEKALEKLSICISRFLDSKKKNEYIEERRTKTLNVLSATIQTPKECRNEILTILDNNEFSTSIMEGVENELCEVSEIQDNLIKKDTPARIKKNIKPKILKGVYERIYRNINNRVTLPLKKEKEDDEDLPFILEKEDQEQDTIELSDDDIDPIETPLTKEEEKELFGSSSEEDNDDEL